MDNNQDFTTQEVAPIQEPQPQKEPRKRIKVSLLLYITTVFIVAIACILATFSITREALNAKYNEALIEAKKGYTATAFQQKLDFIEKYVNSYYIKNFDLIEAEDAAVNAFIEALGDDYTYYLTTEEFADMVNNSKGILYGIGVRAAAHPDRGVICILTVMPDSPAAQAGLQEYDYITAVEGTPITFDNYDESIRNIKGAEGTTVKLTIERGDQTFDLDVKRGAVNTVSADYRKVADGIACITIYEFKENTPEQFKTAIQQAQDAGCGKYVFDLRNCPGGNLDAIEDILDYLLPEGPIVNIVYADGTKETHSSDASEFVAPMVVLCNGDTASAGELFTAALRDYEKATVVGTTTFGKGTMQTYRQFSDGSGFRMSIAYYNPPCNISYEGTGITPDVTVELNEEEKKYFYFLMDIEDPQLQKAIEILTND